MNPVLKVEELTKIFSGRNGTDHRAVDGVSFELMNDECLGIIGESGSGKTTLVNMITRLTETTSGAILLDGQDITHLSGKALRPVYRKMQMVFQTPTESFDPRRTLGDGIGESLKNAGKSSAEVKAAVSELLEMCGLPGEYARRYPHQVSGGECQRAAIARAIAIRPKLLICDEATSALDVTIQAQILNLLQRLRRELQLSILFICHDLALVHQFCDRVLVMYRGRIVEEGRPQQVIAQPADDYTRRLIDSALSTGG